MSEAKPKSEMTGHERYKAWKDWWRPADVFYLRAQQFAITMEHDDSDWRGKRKYYKKMLERAREYEFDTKEETTWEGFCQWNQDRKQAKWDKKAKNEAITEEEN